MDIALGIFIIFPVGAAIVGLLFIRLFVQLRQVFCGLTGVAWLGYSLYEYLMYARVLCTGECNIRVDLLLIYPVLFILSALTLILYFMKKRKLRVIE